MRERLVYCVLVVELSGMRMGGVMKKLIGCLCLVCLLSGCESDASWYDLGEGAYPILHGEAAREARYSGVVALYNTMKSVTCGEPGIECTGTLVHPEWVVTAAHCVRAFKDPVGDEVVSTVVDKPCNAYLRVGVGQQSSEYIRELYKVDQIYVPDTLMGSYIDEARKWYLMEGDIALMHLAESVPSEVAIPIPILSREVLGDDLGAMLALRHQVAGYGYDASGRMGERLKVDVSVSKICAQSSACRLGVDYCDVGDVEVVGCHPDDVMADGRCWSWMDYTEHVIMPCGSVYYAQYSGGPCQGDSGGPMLTEVGGRIYLSGVTSYGDSICQVYGVSTAVSVYLDWIKGIAPEIFEQSWEICGNGKDDDGNGLKDCEDSECFGEKSCDKGENGGSVLDTEQEETSGDSDEDSGCSVSGIRRSRMVDGGIWGVFLGIILVLRGRRKKELSA